MIVVVIIFRFVLIDVFVIVIALSMSVQLITYYWFLCPPLHSTLRMILRIRAGGGTWRRSVWEGIVGCSSAVAGRR
jgi:hypothetical protein